MEGYIRFFSKYGITCQAVTKDELGLVHRQVEWFFMGTDLSKPKEGIIKIHDYGSTSMPPFRWWKDFYKSFINTQPDARIYQNEFVKRAFNIKDRQPFFYCHVGVPDEWLNTVAPTGNKIYDFIYVGDLSPKRQPELLLNCFTRGSLQQQTLLVLGKEYDSLQQLYRNNTNIIFKGPVPRSEVRSFIEDARFGINYIPDLKPFNQLTPTKFLEYAACGIPVITTDYNWIRKFAQQYGGSYFFLAPDFSNFTWENVNNFTYANPDLTEWTTEALIRKSGILEFLESKFPEVKF